jgi:hypothetical protein
LALRVPVVVLRAVVSTPSVPALVIRHDPRRQPSADVVVVAGAEGAAPVGVGRLVSVGATEVDGESVAVLAVGLVVPDETGAVAVDCEPEPDVDPEPDSPHTAPTARPTTAATANADATRPPAGTDPADRSLLMAPA